MHGTTTQTTHPEVVIIGFGNDLRGDDALGPMAGAFLQNLYEGRENIEVLIRTSLTPELAGVIAEAELVVFVDCAAEGPVGVVRQQQITIESTEQSMVHFLTPAALLAWTHQLFGRVPEAWTYSVAGLSFDISEALTPPLQAALPKLQQQVQGKVASFLQRPRPFRP